MVPRAGKKIQIKALDLDLTASYEGAETYDFTGKLDLATAVLRNFRPDRGFDIYMHCEAPPGSGRQPHAEGRRLALAPQAVAHRHLVRRWAGPADLDRRGAGQHDGIGHGKAAAQLVDLGERVRKLARIVDRPVLLREEADSGSVRTTTFVRASERGR